jgi:hypothetical protein
MRLSPLGLGLFRRGDLELPVRPGDPGPDRAEDPGGYLDVAHVGDVGDRARPLAQDGGDHVLGNGVLGAVNLHVASERAVGLYEPSV